ncbi:BMQ_0737 family morphogenetic spore coat protein [Aneurinibacillus sp. REN35]|uniref:Ig-like domain-containing protein n=1 Tax=Aneurinibacillus sp. REN35 TaxID=3237286 RepID=UPI00352942DE
MATESITTLTSSPNPSAYGQSVTFTATVVSVPPGLGTPTGTVTFTEGATVLGTASLDGGGTAALTTNGLSAGTHQITAIYSGDANFQGSASAPVSQIVNQASTTTTLTSSPNPSAYGQPVTFTATVVSVPPGLGTPTGTVTFTEGATVLGTASLDGDGTAALTTNGLSAGTHQITAIYSGDANFQGSTSAPVDQVVNPMSCLLQASCFLSDENGRPLDPLAKGSIVCGEILQKDGRKEIPIVLPNGERITLQKVTIRKKGFVVVQITSATTMQRTQPIPFHIVETFLLCVPPKTNIHCEITSFECEVNFWCDTHQNIQQFHIALTLCQSVEVEGKVTLMVEGIDCQPREELFSSCSSPHIPSSIRSTASSQNNEQEMVCVQSTKIYDWVTRPVNSTISIPFDQVKWM